MIGWRYLKLDESLQVTEDLISLSTTNPGRFDILDRFETTNEFNGFDFGWQCRRSRGRWFCDGLFRMAVGMTQQTVRINGQTAIEPAGSSPQLSDGGLLAQTSNIGTYSRDQFSIVPEINANLGYQFCDCLGIFLGYTGVYWSNVVRPGDQISRDVNPNLLPPPVDPLTGSQRPQFVFRETSFYAQGFNFGLDCRF